MAPLPAREIQPEVDFMDYTIGRMAGVVNGQLGGNVQRMNKTAWLRIFP